ncbi:MAG: DNA primase [Candidatus Omnitrophica bacterium]|nr:DNA primase [Candidatus Omnitrophota bacterium]
MPKIIPPEVINDIQDRCDIVELIASYIPLKRAGRNFKASCPFHNEKTPSFIVSPEKQIYHCFGCGEGGNILSFLMKYERMDFKEAIETLAKRAGIAIHLEENDKEKSYITELYRINEIAGDFYQSYLLKRANPNLQKHLESRKLNKETLNKFKIGLAPNQWDGLINYLRAKSINLKLIEKVGLIISKENGGFYDRFRNRLIIPICDLKNRIIAFGARALDESMPKYINSPETQIYVKGKNLFGLNSAKDSVRQKDYCIIAEGYFDVITPMQEGLLNIVSSSGTALTIEQIRLLKRYTKNVVVVYDSDSAGQLATLRSLDLFLEEDMNVKIVDLPKGYDPDLFVRKFGIGKFQNLVDNSLDIFDYKLKVLSKIYDVRKINEKSKIAIEMLSMIKRIKNEILKSEYIKLLSEKISVNEESLIKELNKINISQTTYTWSDAGKNINNTYPKAERMLIKLIFDDAKITKDLKEFINPTDLQDKRLQKILELVFSLFDSYAQLKPNQIINYLDDEKCINLVSELTSEETLVCKTEDRDNVLQDCIKRIKSNSINLQCQNLHTRIKNAQSSGDAECVNTLMKEFNLLIKKRGKINEKIGN